MSRLHLGDSGTAFTQNNSQHGHVNSELMITKDNIIGHSERLEGRLLSLLSKLRLVSVVFILARKNVQKKGHLQLISSTASRFIRAARCTHRTHACSLRDFLQSRVSPHHTLCAQREPRTSASFMDGCPHSMDVPLRMDVPLPLNCEIAAHHWGWYLTTCSA